MTASTPSCPTPEGVACARVRVEGGRFTLGQDGTPAAPMQPEVTVSDFVVDATEVTVERFRRFVDLAEAGTLPERFVARYPTVPPAEIVVLRAELPASLSGTLANCNWSALSRVGPREQHPMNCVGVNVAQAFCAWDGGRLPTEAELEYLGRYWRSPAGREWPWGAGAPTCDRTHWRASMAAAFECRGDDGLRTRRVGAVGTSWYGVYDLAGNVAEWTADVFAPYAASAAPNACWGLGAQANPLCRSAASDARVVRGGGWDAEAYESLRGWARDFSRVHSTPAGVGFRCARAP